MCDITVNLINYDDMEQTDYFNRNEARTKLTTCTFLPGLNYALKNNLLFPEEKKKQERKKKHMYQRNIFLLTMRKLNNILNNMHVWNLIILTNKR